MSIIFDALKKAQQDKKEDNTAIKTPLVTQPMVNPVSTQPFKGNSKPVVLIGAVIVALAVLGVSSGYYFYKKWSVSGTSSSVAKASSASPVPLSKKVPDTSKIREEALSLYGEGNLEGSQEKWERIITLNPADAEAHNNLGLIQKKLGDRAKATTLYRKAINLKADYPEALNNLAAVLMEESRPPKESLTLLNKAIQLSSTYPDPHFHLAIIHQKQGQNAEAAEHYAEFLKLSPEIDPKLKDQIEMRITLLSASHGGAR